MTTGLIARLGSWCFRRRWWVAAAWLVVFGAGIAASGLVFDRLAEFNSSEQTESARGRDVLQAAASSSGQVVAFVDEVDPAVPGVAAAVRRAADDLAGRGDVQRVDTPYPPGRSEPEARELLSKDGRGLLVVATLTTLSPSDRDTAVEEIRARLHRLTAELSAAGQLQATVRVGGEPVVDFEVRQAIHADTRRGEIVALPVALVVLVLVFGSLLAGVMPLVTAVVTGGSAMLLILGFTYAADVDEHVIIVNMLALALAIDYALLLVGRYREELFAGHAPDVAVARAWATAGRTVMFSSLILAAAISGMLAFDNVGLRGLGAGGISIALVSALVSLTMTAALLGMAGRRIKPAPPATHAAQPRFQFIPAKAFMRIAAFVQRRAWAVALATGALLLVAGIPALSTTLRTDDLSTLPRSLESVQVADELVEQFGRASAASVTVVARSDAASLDRWAARFKGDPAVAAVAPASAVGPDLATVDLAVAGDDAQSAQAQELVRRLRADRPDAAQTWVTGDAAGLIDLTDMIVDRFPVAVGLTLVAIFALLFAMTGSLVVPVKAVLANVVSLGATLGIMNLVFQQGFLAPLLGVQTVAGIDPFLVVVVLVLAFAFSVDYEVFLISRISERVHRERGAGGDERGAGGDGSRAEASRLSRLTDIAVREGLEHTGRIITCAALLMVIVFLGAASGEIAGTEQIGIGLAAALVIDATIIRCLLVPASMTLMGRWNWWAPAALRKLHARIGLTERPLPEPLPEPAP